jgi:hypothetical protein
MPKKGLLSNEIRIFFTGDVPSKTVPRFFALAQTHP